MRSPRNSPLVPHNLLDVNDDATCDAVFALPEITSGFVNLIATNDTDGVPFLIAVLDDGTQARIDAAQ